MSIKSDEHLFRAAVLNSSRQHPRDHAWAIAERIGIPPKRALALVEKWTDRGWWDYGVSPLTGWLTNEGTDEFSRSTSTP